jgi:hypothetical protein
MDMKQAESWLTWLYGDAPASRIWIGGHADGFAGRTFGAIDEAVDYAAALEAAAGDQSWGVYHRLTQVDASTSGRGAAGDSTVLDAIAIDLDLGQTGHKAANYPPDEASLHLILKEAELPPPTTWVNSGAGRYAFWRLAEPLDLTGEEARAEVADAARAIHRRIRDAAAAHGWKLDNTSDLARVYRLPGTTNRKPGVMAVATWTGSDSGARYELKDLLLSEGSATIGHDRPPSATAALPPSSLFAQPSELRDPTRERAFTVTEAMAFVEPSLAALAGATDGEINVRLNDAACALAHFGEEFWGEDAADRQLDAALSATAYDGQTWKAEDTIASARRGMASDWRAVLTPVTTAEMAASITAGQGEDEADPVQALLDEMLTFEQVRTIAPPRYLIHGLLQFDSESWIIGAPGSKKSFVALDMAARVARGEREWQGRKVNPADVVMIVAEGAGGVGKRVKAWRERYGTADGIRFLPRPVQSTERVMGAIHLSREWRILALACERLAASARERGRGLFVIVDTQARVTVGLNENSSEEMGHYIEAVRLIRSMTEACVVSVHHTGRTGGDARGSSAIDGAQTTEIKIDSKAKSLTGKLIVEKQKDMEEIDPIDIAFDVVALGVDADGEPVTSLVMAEAGSVAFKAAWAGSEVGAAGADAGVTPFKERTALDSWIVGEVDSRAAAQHWIVQALVDTAETLGLTQSEVRGLVEEKRGRMDNSTWRRAWQKVTNESGLWSHVVRPASGQRWTVDRLAIEEAVQNLDG